MEMSWEVNPYWLVPWDKEMLMIQLEPGTQGTAEKQQGVNIHSRQHPRLVCITSGEARNRPVMAKLLVAQTVMKRTWKTNRKQDKRINQETEMKMWKDKKVQGIKKKQQAWQSGWKALWISIAEKSKRHESGSTKTAASHQLSRNSLGTGTWP